MDKPELTPMTLREIVEQVRSEMRCNCDLDNWTPEQDTGHSWVCRIHKESKARYSKNPRLRARESEAGQ